MASLSLLLRWSWRDLRAHWAKVLAIALVIAIGTGGYAGLTSNANWRRASYEASYGLLDMYDLRLELATGGYAPEGSLRDAAASIPLGEAIDAVEERLITPTLLDASHGSETVLVRSEITGTDFSGEGPDVNGYHAFTGRLLSEADAGATTVMVERNFARFYELPDAGTVQISGGRQLEYVGQASTPEYFTVAPEGEIFMSEANFGALFTTLETAQMLAGRPGEVNDAVLTLRPGTDQDAVREELAAALASRGIGAEITTRDDNRAYHTLTTDVDNDQQMFNVLAFLLFAGAVGAAFNLIHRLAEQQRREIGISMALGVPSKRIAVRPLLVSAQIALLGVVLGIGVGMLIGSGFQGVLEDLVPLPVWDTSFQVGVFAGAGAIGFLIPFAATIFPVARAVRVTPVEAIRPPHLAKKQGTSQTRHSFSLNTFTLMPFRNLLRAKRRTLLTTLGIAAVVTILVSFLGMMDSFLGVLDDAEAETIGGNPERVVVALDGFHETGSPEVQSIAAAETVGAAEPSIRVGATVASERDEFDVLLEVLDLDGAMWTPTIVAGSPGSGPGIVLAEEAAADLGVRVGDAITVRHPRRAEPSTFRLVDSSLSVRALHPHPIRSFAYVDTVSADLLGLSGTANYLQVDPADDFAEADVQRELFGFDAVASVQSATSATRAVRDQMQAFLGVIQFMALIVLLLALLIAFNSASISLDSRIREHATMFAYGVRVRTAMRMAMTENLVIGVAATIAGLLAGIGMLTWMTGRLLASTLPEFGLRVILEPTTIGAVVVLGIVAVTVAPVFTVRRLRRMDLPGTLRLVE